MDKAENTEGFIPNVYLLNPHFPYRIVIGKEKTPNVSKPTIMCYLILLFIGVSKFFKAQKMKPQSLGWFLLLGFFIFLKGKKTRN